MPPRPAIIGPVDVYRQAATLLQAHLHWHDHDPKCTAQRLLRILCYAAASLCSVFAACGRLREAPSDQVVRNALQRLCPEVHPLEAQLNAALGAVVIRGRNASHPRGPGATRIFALRKRSGWARYTLTNAARQTATTTLCIHCRNWQGRRGRRGRQTLVYACGGVRPHTTQWVYQTYRRRFGIELAIKRLKSLANLARAGQSPDRLLPG